MCGNTGGNVIIGEDNIFGIREKIRKNIFEIREKHGTYIFEIRDII